MDIGFPAEIDCVTGPGEFLLFPEWNTSNRKGQNGKVAILGGGVFSGAPSLAALGSYRSGSDLVHVFIPESSYGAVSKFIPELIVHKLDGELVSSDNIEDLFNYGFDSVVVGPGMGKDPKSFEAVQRIIDNFDNVVIDADAIKLYDFSDDKCILSVRLEDYQTVRETLQDGRVISITSSGKIRLVRQRLEIEKKPRKR